MEDDDTNPLWRNNGLKVVNLIYLVLRRHDVAALSPKLGIIEVEFLNRR